MYFYYNFFSKYAADADTLLISLHTVYGRRAAANSSKAMDLTVRLQVLTSGSGPANTFFTFEAAGTRNC
jgi:hypothetical protein